MPKVIAFTKDRDEPFSLLLACQYAEYPLSCNPAVRKLLIRLGKSLFLESGKATTRVKQRITAAFEGTGPPNRIPTRASRGRCCSLETRGRVRFVPNKLELVRYLPSLPEWTRT